MLLTSPQAGTEGGRREFPAGRDPRTDMASESACWSLVQKPLLGDQVLQKKDEVLRDRRT